jgi:hypothetical protein
MLTTALRSFHTYADAELIRHRVTVDTTVTKHVIIQERDISYRFSLHVHPFVTQLVQRLIEESVRGLEAEDTHWERTADETIETLPDGKNKPVLYAEVFSSADYNPTALVADPRPVRDLDFTSGGAYSVYNWELFYHVPLAIAQQLSQNQRYAEAQRWLHLLFDPTDDSGDPSPQRFWKVRPFQYTHVVSAEELLVNLATGADAELRDETIRSIEAWRNAPFRPHVVARYRQQAYMFKTVMAYLDNLVAWADSLFRQDTGEAIDEATMLYVLAANILGPRPQTVPVKGSIRPQTYANLRADLNTFGNSLREIEAETPFELGPFPAAPAVEEERVATLRSLGKALYFCVPGNDKLLGYWDTVADRLFKIHNSLNLQGVFRRLPLWEPRIDPALLARAVAAGLDIGAVVNGLNQPLPLVRFQLLAQKAMEVCQEVKALGTNLLSAMEKEDGEALALLRSKHERAILQLVEHVKYTQLQEASKSHEGLLRSLALAVQRYTFSERQLGKQPSEISVPELAELDRSSLDSMKFAMEEPELAPRELTIDIAQDLGASGGKIVSSFEAKELELQDEARTAHDASQGLKLTAQGLGLIPDVGINIHFWGLGGNSGLIGGKKLAMVSSFAGDVAAAIADRLNFESARAGKIGVYARRELDWTYQSNLAAGEISQIFMQLRAAELRIAAAEWDLTSHRQQMKNADEIERFLNEDGARIDARAKTTNKALYSWLKREVRGLYAQSFQLAFDVAKKAERALQHELGDPSISFLQFGYLAGKEGLLAGERLFHDVKRMELAYHDLNQREYELTKHVSLQQLNPMALLQLRTTGRCSVSLPEALFDMECPGHYFRRIKSVAATVPCVTGPYTGINCTLTLLDSSVRTSPVLANGAYARDGVEDPRFADYYGSIQSVVTSSGQNDSGLFETSLRDERLLPFEYSGVVGDWQLELPADPTQNDPTLFDYDTISDVILHIRYTAREGGELLRLAALKNVKGLIKNAEAPGTIRLFSLRHDFPTEWAKFMGQQPAANERYALSLTLGEEHYPYWSRGRLDTVERVDLLAETDAPSLDVYDTGDQQAAAANKVTLTKDVYGKLLHARLTHSLPAKPIGAINVYLDTNAIDDIWVAVTWSGE